MYVGSRHTATAQAHQYLPFHCPACGHQAWALVWGMGQGSGRSAYFLDEAGAQQRAASASQQAAAAAVHFNLKLARCPRCHVRDEAAVRGLKVYAAMMAAAVFAVVGAIGVGMNLQEHVAYGPLLSVPLGALLAWATWRVQRRAWTTVDAMVQFLPLQEPPAQAAAAGPGVGLAVQ